jgi:hypothetical protein
MELQKYASSPGDVALTARSVYHLRSQSIPALPLGVVVTAMGEKVWGAMGAEVFMWVTRLSCFVVHNFCLEMPPQRASVGSASKQRSRKATNTSTLFPSQHSLRLSGMCREFRLLLQKS